jgi:hypothetical protein
VARVAEGEALEATTAVGERVGFSLEVENRQEAYGSVAPALTPLVGEDGTSWFPAAEVQPTSTLLPPGEVVEVEIAVDVPEQLPAGRYRGALLLQGFRQDALPVVIEVRDDGIDRGTGGEPDADTDTTGDRATDTTGDRATETTRERATETTRERGTDTTPERGTDEARGSGSPTEPPHRAAGGPDGDRDTA